MSFFIRVVSLLLLLIGTPAWSIMVLPLDLSHMTAQAGRVFAGRCLEISTELDENQIPVTYVRFQVQDGIKGISDGEQILVKFFGIQRDVRPWNEGEKIIVPLKTISVGLKNYEPGQDYLMFLYPESDLGFTSPVGAGQGQFQILVDEKGNKSVLNPLGNQNLQGSLVKNSSGAVPLDRIKTDVQRLTIEQGSGGVSP